MEEWQMECGEKMIFEEPLISVMIPVYNTGRYLKKSLDSVIYQTYDNLEIIVVNDGSSDNSEEIIMEYMKKDSRIKYVKNEENQGLFKARLRGYEKAGGEYIVCLDSDDYIGRDYYRSLLNVAQEENADIVVSDFIEDIESRNEKNVWVQNHLLSHLYLEGEEVLNTFLDTNYLTANWWFMWNKIYKKSLWDKCYKYFIEVESNITYLEDFLYGNILISNAGRYVHTDINAYYYVRHVDSCTGIGNRADEYVKHAKSKIYVIQFLKKYFEKIGLGEVTDKKLSRFAGKHKRDDLDKVEVSSSKKEDKQAVAHEIEKIYGDIEETLQKDTYFARTSGVDGRYEEVKSSICYKDHEVISFDIFDTLILRPFYRPTDLFIMLNPYFEELCSNRPFAEFAKIREDAEKQVRRLSKYQKPQLEEIQLDDIYGYIGEQYGIAKEILAKLKQREIELEIELSRPRRSVQELYYLAIQQKKKVICTSDIYFNKDVIVKILKKNGYNKFDDIFLSSETGVTKASGNLYQYAIRKLDVSPKHVLHIGDNWKSDIEMARQNGCKAFFIPKTVECLENKIPPNKRGHVMDALLKEIPGNWVRYRHAINEFGIRCMCAMVANKFFDNPFLTFDEYTDFNVDPYFIGYFALGMHNFAMARWILEDAKQKHYKKIHFVARDGYAVKKVYDCLKEYDVKAPKSNYLYLSRKAMLPLVITKKEDLFMLDEWINIKLYTPREFIEALGELINIDLGEKEEIAFLQEGVLMDVKLKNRDEYIHLAKVLIEKYLNEEKIQSYRNKMKIYFESIISENEAMFDIGYSGRGQAVLGDLLGITIDAYYIHTLRDTWNSLARTRGFQIYSFYGFTPTITGRQREMIQSDTCPSCVGYRTVDDKIVPIFEDKQIGAMGRYIMNTIHRGMEDFAEDFMRIFHNYLDLIYYDHFNVSFAHEWLMSNIKSKDLHVFSEITFDDDMMEGFYNRKLSDIWEKDLRWFSLKKENTQIPKKTTTECKKQIPAVAVQKAAIIKESGVHLEKGAVIEKNIQEQDVYPENITVPIEIQRLSRNKRIMYYLVFNRKVLIEKIKRAVQKPEKESVTILKKQIDNKSSKSFYYILSNYQLLCCIIHKLVFNRDREAVVLLSAYRKELYQRLIESNIFGREIYLWDDAMFNEYFKQRDLQVDSYTRKDWSAVQKEVFQMVEDKLPFEIDGFYDYYLSADCEVFGNYFISKKIPYSFFEDAAGIFTHTEITKNNWKKLFSHAKARFSERYPINGANPRIKRIYLKKSAQKEGVKLPKNAVDLDVMEQMMCLSEQDVNRILQVFDVKKMDIKEKKNLVLLLTQQMYAFKKMSKTEQNQLYLALVDYFMPVNAMLVVKPHPDDTYSDYKKLFPDCTVLSGKVLSEFLPVMTGTKYEMGITANSMSVFNLAAYMKHTLYFNPEIEVTWRYFDQYYIVAMLAVKASTLGYQCICAGANMIQLNLLLQYACNSKVRFEDTAHMDSGTKRFIFTVSEDFIKADRIAADDMLVSQKKWEGRTLQEKEIRYTFYGDDEELMKRYGTSLFVNEKVIEILKDTIIRKGLLYSKLQYEFCLNCGHEE